MAGPTWISDDSTIPDPLGYGERAVRFLRMLRHPKSRLPNRTYALDRWQERICRRIYGPCRDDGQRLTRVVFLQVGRGNRKTSLGASLALLHTFGQERIQGGQVVSAAADRKQARIAYEEALGIVSVTHPLAAAARVQDFKNRLVHPKSGSVYEAISADAATQFGRTPSFALVDELWCHKKPDLWHSIRTGLAKVSGSLLVITTTAGRGTETPDYPIYDYARKVARGEIDDPSFLPIIFEADRDSDWRDESIWHAVNPGLEHGYPDIDGLRQLAREAAERPADRDAFRQFHLGIRLDKSVSPFVDLDVYDEGSAPIDVDALEGSPCWIAADMATVGDLAAVVAAFKDEEGNYIVLPFAFVPENNLRARGERDGVPYPQWAEDGFITATPGDVIDYGAVESCIRGLCDRFDVKEIAFDPAYAQAVMGPLGDEGYPVAIMRQGWVTMAPAVRELERAIVGRRFRHAGHPVLRWCMDNVVIHTDSAGNRMMHKGKSRDRIDLAVAAAMAVGRASMGDMGASIFDGDDIDPEQFLVSI